MSESAQAKAVIGTLSDRLKVVRSRFQRLEPRVQAFVHESDRFSRCQADAPQIEAQLAAGQALPLYGLTLGVKDIFHVDGLPTQAGSQLPAQALAGAQGPAVSALKRAGALVMGKTVTTEFAYFGAGPTRNPHNLAHTPGGSSSGSAAGVAAGLCDLALGTQTIGSVNRPAAFCGVVGYKPSYDRISRVGVIPLSPSLDHVGLFGPELSTVRRAATLIVDGWQTADGGDPPNLAVPDGSYLQSASREALTHFEDTLALLERSGYEIVRLPILDDIDAIWSRHERILAVEAAQVHAEWFDRYSDLYHPRTAELLELGRSLATTDLQAALLSRDQLRQQLTAELNQHACQLWLSPAAPGPAPEGLESTGNPIMNLPWTHAGMPTLSLPSGKADNGLPLALQLAAPVNADEALFSWAQPIADLLPTPELAFANEVSG